MKIELKKFGETLLSRQSGREAFSAFKPSLASLGKNEDIEIDFSGVITFSPSWGDEFLRPLQEQYNGRIFMTNTHNSSVKVTLELLEEINKNKFDIRS